MLMMHLVCLKNLLQIFNPFPIKIRVLLISGFPVFIYIPVLSYRCIFPNVKCSIVNTYAYNLYPLLISRGKTGMLLTRGSGGGGKALKYFRRHTYFCQFMLSKFLGFTSSFPFCCCCFFFSKYLRTSSKI